MFDFDLEKIQEKFLDFRIYFCIGGLAILGTSYALNACSTPSLNRKKLEKGYNIAIDNNEDVVSITYITSYYSVGAGTYRGRSYGRYFYQFVTQDGLIVFTSLDDTQLVNVASKEELHQYAKVLACNDDSKIYYYDELQNNVTIINNESDTNEESIGETDDFDHILIENENSIIIAKIEAWTEYLNYGEIKIKYANGPIVKRKFDSIKLINSSYASEESIYNYALSLIGDESKIQYLDFEKPKEKTIKYEETNY